MSSFWRTRASTFSPSDDDLVGVDVVADAQLAGGDDALALVADVEQDLVLVDLDDRAVDELAVLDLDHRAVDGVGEGHAEVVDDDLAGGVVALLVEGAHAAEWATVAAEEVRWCRTRNGLLSSGRDVGSRMSRRAIGPATDASYEGSSEPWSIAMALAVIGDGRRPGTRATRSSAGRRRRRRARRC